jgi:hypothetical protein
MSDNDQRSDDAFGERVGRVLRASERFGDHFEADLVEAIRNDVPRGRFVLRHPHRDRRRSLSSRWCRRARLGLRRRLR